MEKTILIVDDDPALCRLYQRELKKERYRVLIGLDGFSTLRMIKEARPDLLVLEVRMRGMGGLELMARVLDIRPDLPIIIYTAYSSYRESFLSWCADVYLLKQPDLTPLKRAVRRLLDERAPLDYSPVAEVPGLAPRPRVTRAAATDGLKDDSDHSKSALLAPETGTRDPHR